MSEQRRQDLVYPPSPASQREQDKEGPHPEALVLTITGRLFSRLSLVSHNEEAILRILRQVPRTDRFHARVALFRAFGGEYTNAGPRALALCERVFGPGTIYFPGEREILKEKDQPSPETPPAASAPRPEPASVLAPEAAFDQGRTETLSELLQRLVSQPPFPPASEILALLDAAESHVAKAALSRLNSTPLPGADRYGRTYYQALQQAAGEIVSDHLTGRREMIERMLPGRYRAGRLQNPPQLPLETRLLHHGGRLGAGHLLGSWDKSATEEAKAQRHAQAEERLAEDHPVLTVLRQGGGEPLPEAALGRMNRLLGHDFSHVRIHTDAKAAEVAELLGARALAFGPHLYFGAGQFAPGTTVGDRLLTHELIHVVQFDEGRLPAARSAGVEVSRPEDGAEREAEARALHLNGASLGSPEQTPAHISEDDTEPRLPQSAEQVRAADTGNRVVIDDLLGEARLQLGGRIASSQAQLERRARTIGRQARELGRRALAGSELLAWARPQLALLDAVAGGAVSSAAGRVRARVDRFLDAPDVPAVAAHATVAPQSATFPPDTHRGVDHAQFQRNLGASSGMPLPDDLADRMRRLLGHDFSHVRVHIDGPADADAEALGARAFAVGSELYFRGDQWRPGTHSFERLLIHELTHVIQHDQGRMQPGAAAPRVTHPGDAVEREAEAAEALAGGAVAEPEHDNRGLRARPTGHAGAGAGQAFSSEPTPRPTPTPHQTRPGHVVAGDFVTDAIASLVRTASPQLADLIETGPGPMIKKALESAVQGFVSGIGKGIGAIGAVAGKLQESFAKAFAFIKGLLNGDPRCCQAVIDAIQSIRNLAKAIAENPGVKAVQAAFEKIGGAIKQVATLVLEPAFDMLQTILGGAWEGVKAIASTIKGWIDTAKSVASSAWDWIAGKLGLPSSSEGGIWEWIKGKAKALWDSLKETLKPVMGPLKVVGGVLLMFTGLPQLYALIKYGPQLVEAIQWLWANKGDPKLVAKAREKYGDGLATVLSAVKAFSGMISSAAGWLAETAGKLASAFLELAGAVTGIPLLSLLKGFINSVKDTAQDIAEWTQGAFKAAVADAKAAVTWFSNLIKPYASIISSIGLAIANPAMIPVILAGWAWQALPDCVKGPIIDLLLDAAIAVLRAMPTLLMFGPLWPILKTGVLGFLEGLRAQTTEVKEKVSNKLAKIISGGSPQFMLGFVKGFFLGVWEGLTDPFVLIYQAVKGLSSLIEWFGDLSKEAFAATPKTPAPAATTAPTKQELGARALQMGGELKPPVEAAASNVMPAAQEAFQGKGETTFSGLVAKLGALWTKIEQAIRGAAASFAGKVCEFLMSDGAEAQMGETVGWLAGTIAFEILLGVLTAGAWQPISAAGKALKVFARILDWTGEALGAAFKALGKLGGLIKKAIGGLADLLKKTGPGKLLIEALETIASKVSKFADELLGRFGKGVADEAGEKAAKETAETAGEKGAKEATEEAGEKGAKEAGEEGGEKAGKKADDAPDLTEKQRVAALAGVESNALEALGTPVVGIVAALKTTFQPRYPWIRDFISRPSGPQRSTIYMIASEVKVDDVDQDGPSSDGRTVTAAGEDADRVFAKRPEETIEQYRERLRAMRDKVEDHALASNSFEQFDEYERRLRQLDIDIKQARKLKADLSQVEQVIERKTQRIERLKQELDEASKSIVGLRGEAREKAAEALQRRSKRYYDELEELKALRSQRSDLSRQVAQVDRNGSQLWRQHRYNDIGQVEPCFAPGTPVKTPEGERAIESLSVGDLVLAYDLEARRIVARRVLTVHCNWTDHIVDLRVEHDTILATRHHPFWIEGAAEWQPAEALHPGDVLRAVDGRTLPLRSSEIREQRSTTFNLEVEDLHNYFVGRVGVLVHNGSSGDSGFTDPTKQQTRIYEIFRKDTGEVVYVGKTLQGEAGDVGTRFAQHVKNKAHWEQLASQGLLDTRMAKEGNWTRFETAVWEQHFIQQNGGLNKLENKIAAITEESYDAFRHLHQPC